MTTLAALPSKAELEERFAKILPLLRRYARLACRKLRCPDLCEDAAAEMQALAWRWCLRLAQKGRDASRFPASLAYRAAQHVRCGRRLCGQERAKDPLSWLCQSRRRFRVERLPSVSTLLGNQYDEALHDNTRTPPPDQAAFRIDWPAFLETRSDRDRALIGRMAMGERTLDLAGDFGMSPARVSQLRAEFHQAWKHFCDDE